MPHPFAAGGASIGVRFGAGAILYQPSCRSRRAYVVHQGLVKLVTYARTGDHRIVRLLGQGDWAGLESVFESPYEHYAVVMDDVVVSRVELRHNYNDLCTTCPPELLHLLIKQLDHARRQSEFFLTALGAGPARHRVLHLLSWLVEASKSDTCFLPLREDISAILGITMETASRIISGLGREGLIDRIERNRIKVDSQAVRNLLESS